MDLIPAPRLLTVHEGAEPFALTARTALDAGPGTQGTARWLRAVLGAAFRAGLPDPGRDAVAVLRLRIDRALPPEGYRLHAGAGGVELSGGDAAGVFWAAQTLRQLLGPEAFRRAPLAGRPAPAVPALTVEDAPAFRWRGFLLDVARHFMPKDVVLRYVDLLAAHKLNVLHLHLTDDQGWRMEVLSHPRLTGVGAWRTRSRVGLGGGEDLWDERPHGGFYTQDDLREIVAYAAERHVTVVPEIDIPGHSQAAIAAYPQLGNVDVIGPEPLPVHTSWGVNPNVLAPSDAVLRFYEDVFTEVLEIFPSEVVHIGGDECPTGQWECSSAAIERVRREELAHEGELLGWFTRHFARWLAERGRRASGWDEILEGVRSAEELPAGTLVSSWRGWSGGIDAARAGHDVVMCPKSDVYLDYRQAAGPDEPTPIGYVRTLEDIYRFHPVPPQLAGTEGEKHVLGGQANLWTEQVDTVRALDYLAFPRLSAFAETVWSRLPEPAARDTAGLAARLAGHLRRLDALGVEYRPPAGPHPWQRRPGVPGRPIEGTPPIV